MPEGRDHLWLISQYGSLSQLLSGKPQAGGVALWQGSFLKRKERGTGRKGARQSGREREGGRQVRDLVYNIPTHQFSLTLSFACMGMQVFEFMWKSEGYVGLSQCSLICVCV